MNLEPRRLRTGEVIVGAGALVLLVSLFALDWYGPSGQHAGPRPSSTGWSGLTTLRWLILVTAACGLALTVLQAVRRAPAVPVSLSVVVTVLGLLCTLALIYRVLINPPGADVDQKVGAYVGLISAAAIACGGWLSLRQEGILVEDGPAEIETVQLKNAGGS
ncbi:MAG: hypothetical protein JO153_22130 [Solirubrobacterales bacterium]|nr:hypothetical protein [Solirubrobacterales bacterium]MBV9919214.1 hypothetical protein [Solirubrobacterales bacterium]